MLKPYSKLLLVVVAKAPRPQQVKTRLSPDLSADEATSLYKCFISDRIKEVSLLNGIDLAISYTPADSEAFFEKFLSNGFQLFPQRGKDLGERLHNIFLEKLQEGYQAVSIIDSDTPDLPRTIICQSFELLTAGNIDAVFGPCHDGGYYLVGLRQPHPELFEGIAWSTDTVLQETLARTEKFGIRARLLERWNDLDTFEDLLKFYHKYQDKMPDQQWTGCETFNFLSRMKSIRKHHKS